VWIPKGILLGIVLFIVGGISFVGIDIAIGLYRLTQQLKAGTARHGGGTQYDISLWLNLLHSPVFWAVFLAAIAIGLWIMRARTTRTI